MKSSDSIRCIRKYKKKDGSFSYHAEVRRKHSKPIRKRFITLTEAKNWVRKTESSILDGKTVLDNKARKHTLSDLIDRYIDLHLSKFPRRLKDQTPHFKWWKEHFGHTSLVGITPSLLSEAKEMLLNEEILNQKKRSNATVNRYFSSLSRAFSIALLEWEWIRENPFRRISKLKESGGRTRFLSKEEFHSLLKFCKSSKNPHLYGFVLIAGTIGLRFGEIVELRWKHIDFENGFVTLEKTKNGDVRHVPLPDQIEAYLTGIERPKFPEEFVFPPKNPEKRHPYSMIRKSFQTALKKAGIKGICFHSLRHGACSHLAMAGATQGELMEILGHRSPAMTKRYAHFSKKHIAQVLQKSSDQLFETKEDSNDNLSTA